MLSGKGAVSLIISVLMTLGVAGAQEDVRVYTDTFRPFILPEAAAEGPGTRLVDMILRNAGYKADFDYTEFAFGLHAVGNGEEAVSFPWRYSDGRAERVVFSEPLMTLVNAFHYKLPSSVGGPQAPDPASARIGRVTSYAFAGEIAGVLSDAEGEDRVTGYPSEQAALGALLAGEIDLLPLPRRVVRATLRSDYPYEVELIATLDDGPEESYALHAVAPRNAWGRELMQRFDRSLAELRSAEVIGESYLDSSLEEATPRDTAVLRSAEGFPVIIGTLKDDEARQYAIPEGTRVLVREWSGRILEPSGNEQLYRTMTASSLVLVLNGPHLGKELYVKNMHLVIAE